MCTYFMFRLMMKVNIKIAIRYIEMNKNIESFSQ